MRIMRNLYELLKRINMSSKKKKVSSSSEENSDDSGNSEETIILHSPPYEISSIRQSRTKTPHFLSIAKEEPKGLELIKDINQELDAISVGIECIKLSARIPKEPVKTTRSYIETRTMKDNIVKNLPKPTKRVLIDQREIPFICKSSYPDNYFL